MITPPDIHVSPHDSSRPSVELRALDVGELDRSGLMAVGDPVVRADLADIRASELAQRFELEGRSAWGIYATEQGQQRLVGFTALGHAWPEYPEYDDVMSTTTYILDPVARGKGIGTAARLGVIRYALQRKRANVITCEVGLTNIASQHLTRKLGFIALEAPYRSSQLNRMMQTYFLFNPNSVRTDSKALSDWGTDEQHNVSAHTYEQIRGEFTVNIS